MRKTRHPWSWTLALILLAPCLLGTTYKWVDPQGQVHFTDSPPSAGTAYEVIAAPRSPSLSPPGPAVPAPASVTETPAPTVSVAVDIPRDDARCVDALMQLQVLAGDWKVYKPGPGDDRAYLHDRDRPAEIERLARERNANCSDDPAGFAVEKRHADDLFRALSPDCREAREKLQNLQRPTARTAPSDIEKQQAYLAAHCPDVSRDGVWLADWFYVRNR